MNIEKILLIIGLILVVQVSGCSDHDLFTIRGSWKLHFTEGGYVSHDPTNMPEMILVFNKTTYALYRDGSLIDSGMYKLGGSVSSSNDDSSMRELTFKGTQNYDVKVGKRDGTLVIEYGPIAVDGVVQYYQKYEGTIP